MLIEANEKHSLLRIAYSRKNCYFSVWEDYFKRTLYMTAPLGGEQAHVTDLRFDIDYLEDGQPVRYHYFGDEGSLTMRTRTPGKWSELLLTGDDQLRFRGIRNTGLRLTLTSMLPERGAAALHSAARLKDGSVEAVMGKYGSFRFIPLQGSISFHADYDREKGEYAEFFVDIMPDEEGRYECALLYYNGDCSMPEQWRSFDELREENLRSFAEFFRHYRKLPEEWNETEEELVYMIWSHVMKPKGYVCVPMVMMHRNCLCMAMNWQQSFNAMAMLEDPATGFALIESMFCYQDPVSGALPVYVNPGIVNDTNTQPPLQGFALTFLVRFCGEDFITKEMAERLLPRMERWIGFWTTWRSAGRGDDLIMINNPTEAGMDDASIFVKGFPTITPDIQAELAECMYACAILARRMGDTEREQAWNARADRLLNTIVTEFWDGERFVTKYRGEPVESMSLACYLPILLGDRLPKEIARKTAQALLKDGEFMCRWGLCTEKQMSPMSHWGWHFTLGRVIMEANMFCSLGLFLAGETEAARTIAKAWCDTVAQRGPRLGFTPGYFYPRTGEPTDIVMMPHIGDGWSWTSWSACGTLAMLETILS